MNTGTACDDDAHVLRAVGDANVLGIADLREPARPTVFETLDRALAEARQRNAGALEHGLLDVFLTDAVAVEGPSVLRAEYQERPRREDDVVVAETHHGADQVSQNLLSGVAAEGKFAGLTVGRHVGLAWKIAADIAQHELHSSADGRIRAPASTKEVAP